jgi:formiminotetrahydrofolate cyclodeaminase
VACELLMGAINGTVHVVIDNLQAIEVSKKKENYLTRLKELHGDCKKNYSEVIERISK